MAKIKGKPIVGTFRALPFVTAFGQGYWHCKAVICDASFSLTLIPFFCLFLLLLYSFLSFLGCIGGALGLHLECSRDAFGMLWIFLDFMSTYLVLYRPFYFFHGLYSRLLTLYSCHLWCIFCIDLNSLCVWGNNYDFSLRLAFTSFS